MTEQLGDYMPSGGMSKDHMKPDTFAKLLAKATKVAALKGIKGSQLKVIPLAAFRYSDGEHAMLTVTTLLADDALASKTESDDVYKNWVFRSRDWDDVHHVNVPDLSAKERLTINQLIAREINPETIHEQLPLRFHSKNEESLNLLANYLHHYRRYPTFGRVQ